MRDLRDFTSFTVYDMPAGVWVPCFKAGPARNPAGTFGVGYESTGHCGLGRWHASFTAAYAWDGTAWRGAWVGSNNEWLPAPSAASTDSPSASSTPKPKISAADALKRGEVRLGSPDGPKVTAAELHKPPSVRGDAPVEPVEPVASDGTHTVWTLTAR
ncbi:hypothetical protein ACIRL2_49295 [Embleya sp. NPDC127516]|uniref:hypothetical protein n=1 Tax=Embleya sp. NPDC127516 TaxID=3363990 RepID=UPI00382EA694